jgi:hypothetical protein
MLKLHESTVVCFTLLFLGASCQTYMSVHVENCSPGTVTVRSLQTGHEIWVKTNRFGRLSHSIGDIIVKTEAGESFRFPNVVVAAIEMDPRFYDIHDHLFRTDRVDLNLLLQTNMQLYVLLPGKKTVDEKLVQPKGYPKAGQHVLSETTGPGVAPPPQP